MSVTSASRRLAAPSSMGMNLGGFGGAFLLINVLSSKIYELLAESTQTIIKAYESGGLIGLVRSSDFRALLRRYIWLISLAVGFERLRRTWNRTNLVEYLTQYFYVDALVKPGDQAYEWLLAYWTANPAFKTRSRNFVIETKPNKKTRNQLIQMRHRLMEVEQGPGENQALIKSEEIQPLLMPKETASQYIWESGTLFRFKRWQVVARPSDDAGYGSPPVDSSLMSIRSYSFTRRPLFKLLKKAKEVYDRVQPEMITIRVLDQRGSWRRVAYKHRRPLASIIMDDDKRQELLCDIKEFLQSETWYNQRGIPWKRGVLLHGAPGTGKSSTIQALASEVHLDVYVISINSPTMSDAGLQAAMRTIPPRSILCMEDVDVAVAAQKRNSEQPPAVAVSARRPGMPGPMGMMGMGSGGMLSLSSILNAIDGVEASEGRILFMTTNRISDLDAALTRPGRIDLSIEYRRASRSQAEQLFKIFYSAGQPELQEADPLLEPSLADAVDSTTQSGSISPSAILEKANEHPFKLADNITPEMIAAWAKSWSEYVDDEKYSIAELQGMLLGYKREPESAVKDMPQWIEKKALAAKKAQELQQKAAVALANLEKSTEEALKESKDIVAKSPRKESKKTKIPTVESAESLEMETKEEDKMVDKEGTPAAVPTQAAEVEQAKEAEEIVAVPASAE